MLPGRFTPHRAHDPGRGVRVRGAGRSCADPGHGVNRQDPEGASPMRPVRAVATIVGTTAST